MFHAVFTWYWFIISLFFPQDTFFYSLVYDPQAKTLLADKGEIRIGPTYQAEVTDLLKEGEYRCWLS